jgi:chromosome segregation ATPase
MSKTPQLTYAVYVKAREELEREGVADPSVRDVRARIGFGSNSTLLQYKQQWTEERALASTVNSGISESFKQAITAEIGRAIQSTREGLENSLEQARKQTREANQLLEDAENRIAELEMMRQTEQEAAQAKILELEKELAAAREQIREQQQQNEKLEQQLKESVIAQEASRVDAAKAKLQLERADNDTKKAENRVNELETKLEKVLESEKQYQIKAAVAEARVKELEKQVK